MRRRVLVEELVSDSLLAGEGRGVIYVPVNNFEDGDLRAVLGMLTHEVTVPGLGDAGAHRTMICDASFPPTHLLSYWGGTLPPTSACQSSGS